MWSILGGAFVDNDFVAKLTRQNSSGAAPSFGFGALEARQDSFPVYLPLSPDGRDVLVYVDQPLTAPKPVGYQRDFLESYQPNRTWYLSEPLRRQLRKMGDTGQTRLPAGTYGRAVLNRLLIDLSWASSHLEGNTYSRLDPRQLIEHGRAALGKAAIETQMVLKIDEIWRLHEGVLARYGLRQSEFVEWQSRQRST